MENTNKPNRIKYLHFSFFVFFALAFIATRKSRSTNKKSPPKEGDLHSRSTTIAQGLEQFDSGYKDAFAFLSVTPGGNLVGFKVQVQQNNSMAWYELASKAMEKVENKGRFPLSHGTAPAISMKRNRNSVALGF